MSLTRATLRPDLAILTMSGILEARPRVGYYYNGEETGKLGEEFRELEVSNFKSVPIVVKDTTTLYDAVVSMFMEDVDILFVVNSDNYLEGVLSRKDLLKITLGQMDIHKVPVSVMMTRVPNVITITPEASIYQAAKKLLDYEVNALPVIRNHESDGEAKMELIGSISKTTITKIMVELAER
ncbi:CBS domain-containing protein [Desulfitispora alkaliphila]